MTEQNTNTQQNLPGVAENKGDDKSAELKAIQDRAAAAERKLADIEARTKKESDSKKAADDEAAKNKAIEDGNAKALIEKQSAELKAAQEKLDAINAATQKRIDAMVEKMPDASKKKIELVKSGLSVDKLLEFVEAEGESISNGQGQAIAGGTPGSSGEGKKEFKLSPEATNHLGDNDIGVGNIGMFEKQVSPTNPNSFKLVLPTKKLIDNLRGRAMKPVRMSSEEWAKRSGTRR